MNKSVYQALYRKYRPQTFDDVVGQGSITQILRAQVVTGKLSHAYLFTGSRGTGKTTCSKILAKAVNCLHPVDGNPCNCCAACQSIDSGACMDVLEIDAASNNGVDNVRTLREDAVYAPTQVKKRVYIIDEVHMLSMSAFNALLKIIEEPPPHLMFILATTELHKVPATILSRCQRFSFRRIDPADVAARIHYVAYEEGLDVTEEAAMLLGRLADGALRDGLSLLDQCAAAASGQITPETVYNTLGIAGSKAAGELLSAAADRDTGRVLSLLTRQYAEGKDLAALVAQNRASDRRFHADRRLHRRRAAGPAAPLLRRGAAAAHPAAAGHRLRLQQKRQPADRRGALPAADVRANAGRRRPGHERQALPPGDRAGIRRAPGPPAEADPGAGAWGTGSPCRAPAGHSAGAGARSAPARVVLGGSGGRDAEVAALSGRLFQHK